MKERFKITRRQHNEIIGKMSRFKRCEGIYYEDYEIAVQYYYTWLFKVLTFFMIPFLPLIYGVRNIPELKEEVISVFKNEDAGFRLYARDERIRFDKLEEIHVDFSSG